jgi:hypothetical protein
MPGATRVASKAHTNRNTNCRTQSSSKLVDWLGGGKICRFLDVDPCVAVPLVFVGIRVALEVAEFESGSVGKGPFMLLVLIAGAEERE